MVSLFIFTQFFAVRPLSTALNQDLVGKIAQTLEDKMRSEMRGLKDPVSKLDFAYKMAENVNRVDIEKIRDVQRVQNLMEHVKTAYELMEEVQGELPRSLVVKKVATKVEIRKVMRRLVKRREELFRSEARLPRFEEMEITLSEKLLNHVFQSKPWLSLHEDKVNYGLRILLQAEALILQLSDENEDVRQLHERIEKYKPLIEKRLQALENARAELRRAA